jgi:hypothetical protein
LSRSLHWRPPNPWTVKVHAGMLESGACLTPEQIKVMYGVPKGGVGIATLLDISGNFEALHGGRWRAVDRLEERKPKWLTLERMGQVPSVFHLR